MLASADAVERVNDRSVTAGTAVDAVGRVVGALDDVGCRASVDVVAGGAAD
jgi:hypothetical protein